MGKSIFSVLMLLALTCSCVKQPAPIADEALPSHLNRISVLPVTSSPETDHESIQNIKELETGVSVLTQSLEEYFVANDTIQIVSPAEVESLSTNYTSAPNAEALRIGKALNAEAVMIWVLTRYRQRQGSDYAVTAPASVAFEY